MNFHSILYFLRDWDSANGVIETMVKNGLEPDVDTYAQLLSGYARHGELNRVTLLIGNYIKFNNITEGPVVTLLSFQKLVRRKIFNSVMMTFSKRTTQQLCTDIQKLETSYLITCVRMLDIIAVVSVSFCDLSPNAKKANRLKSF